MIVGQVNLKPMDSSFQRIGEISSTTDYQYLCVLFQNLIKDVEFYRDQLNLNGNSIAARRETDFIRKKIEIVNETLSSLNFIKTHLEEAVNVIVPISYPSSRGPSDEYADFGVLSLLTETLIGKFKSFTSRKLRECITQLDSLDSGHKSPYDFSSIINELLKSLENNSNPDSQIQLESLLKLAQSELQFIRQSKDMNEGQLTLIKIYCDKLNLLDDELSSIDKETENKPKQKAKKLRDIVNGTRLIIKETFELIVALKTIDWINESDDIFVMINEKGVYSFDDVIDYMEKIKKDWIEFKTVNETSKVCRLAALRRFNVYIKQMKKLSILKSELESDWIILGIKNITNSFNRIEKSSLWIRKSAHWLTYKIMPKPTVNVPDGFIRDDPIYEELNSNLHQHVLIILIHIIRFQ
ncbi:uncharacterized protein LOC128387162 isoform X2 [Panonychus citri]|uniref:uncharacterized protein LOC128387162 isoform X2 n=1 Tax=Panonychus citri TaxID=50023 RepID=UPI0023078F74|nr:uncharacterized protein LOC128387162 isoform X2 [Panonychus citri]